MPLEPIDSFHLDLDETQKRELLALARASVNSAFLDDNPTALQEFEADRARLRGSVVEKLACFVTLTERRNERLRGCIGTLVTHNLLYKNVYYFAREAAFSDPRFMPVEAREVCGLNFHIAVLGPLRPLHDLKALKIGAHGLHVKHGERRGVLLAEVAARYHWSPEEFQKQTCEKAGLPRENPAAYTWSYFEEVNFSEA